MTFHAWTPTSSNMIASCTLAIVVKDAEAPTVLECSPDISIRLEPGLHGQYVHWREPRFVDNVGVVSIRKSKVHF